MTTPKPADRLRAKCPHCGRTLYPTPECFGQSVKCPGCAEPFELFRVRIPRCVLDAVPGTIARERLALPLNADGGGVTVAVAEGSSEDAAELLRFVLGRPVKVLPRPAEALRAEIDRHYPAEDCPSKERSGEDSVESMLADFTDDATDFTEGGVKPRKSRKRVKERLIEPTLPPASQPLNPDLPVWVRLKAREGENRWNRPDGCSFCGKNVEVTLHKARCRVEGTAELTMQYPLCEQCHGLRPFTTCQEGALPVALVIGLPIFLVGVGIYITGASGANTRVVGIVLSVIGLTMTVGLMAARLHLWTEDRKEERYARTLALPWVDQEPVVLTLVSVRFANPHWGKEFAELNGCDWLQKPDKPSAGG